MGVLVLGVLVRSLNNESRSLSGDNLSREMIQIVIMIIRIAIIVMILVIKRI